MVVQDRFLEPLPHRIPVPEYGDITDIEHLLQVFIRSQLSEALLSYRVSLTNLSTRFVLHLPVQDLCHYAHWREGNMPWSKLGTQRALQYPNLEDARGAPWLQRTKYSRHPTMRKRNRCCNAGAGKYRCSVMEGDIRNLSGRIICPAA